MPALTTPALAAGRRITERSDPHKLRNSAALTIGAERKHAAFGLAQTKRNRGGEISVGVWGRAFQHRTGWSSGHDDHGQGDEKVEPAVLERHFVPSGVVGRQIY